MHCTRITLPNGISAIVCGSGRRAARHCTACDQLARFLCDWKIGGGKTCDLPICPVHAEEVAEDKHLCPKHTKAWAQWQAQREGKSAMSSITDAFLVWVAMAPLLAFIFGLAFAWGHSVGKSKSTKLSVESRIYINQDTLTQCLDGQGLRAVPKEFAERMML